MTVSALRNTFLFGLLLLLGVVLCAGDTHVCVNSGPCVGCLHAPVWILTTQPVGETRLMQIGFMAAPAIPKSIPLQVNHEPSLRAPPQQKSL